MPGTQSRRAKRSRLSVITTVTTLTLVRAAGALWGTTFTGLGTHIFTPWAAAPPLKPALKPAMRPAHKIPVHTLRMKLNSTLQRRIILGYCSPSLAQARIESIAKAIMGRLQPASSVSIAIAVGLKSLHGLSTCGQLEMTASTSISALSST